MKSERELRHSVKGDLLLRTTLLSLLSWRNRRKKNKELSPFQKQGHGPPGPRALRALPGRPQREVQRRGVRRAPTSCRRRRSETACKGQCIVGCGECRPSPRRSPRGAFLGKAACCYRRADVLVLDCDRARQAVSTFGTCRRKREREGKRTFLLLNVVADDDDS